MKWENLNLFREMDVIICSLENCKAKENECKAKKNICEHDHKDIDGLITCVKCGLVDRCLFENSYDSTCQKPYKKRRPYERIIYLKNMIRRLSGYYTLEQKKENDNIDLKIVPESLTQIRKFLKGKKMNMKNDYYYFRLKNNIKVEIKCSDRNNWSYDYKKLNNNKKSAKDFLYEKLQSREEYCEIAAMIKKKKMK